MNEIKTALVLTGIITIGTIIISYRYIMAKMKSEEAHWELERPDYIQLDREGWNGR